LKTKANAFWRLQKMKTMKLAVFLGFVVLLVSCSAWASSTCALPTTIAPNGDKLDFDFVPATATNFYQFSLTKGHSYSIAVLQDFDDLDGDITAANVKLYSDALTCAAQVTVPGATPLTAVTTGVDPQLPGNGNRFSIIPSASGTYELGITNSNGATGRYIAVTVAETTLFSSAFFHGGGYITGYTFGNTTSATITGTLTLVDTNGTTVDGTSTLTLPPTGASVITTDGVTHTNATQLIVSGTKGGAAILAHLGPPDSVQGAVYLQNFNYPTPYEQPIEMKPLREGK
jgi:hypothetical protein